MTSTVSIPRWGLAVLSLAALITGGVLGFLGSNLSGHDGLGRVVRRDAVITYVSQTEPEGPVQIQTTVGAFGTTSDVWDGELLRRVVLANAFHENARHIPIRITYAVPRDGTEAVLRIDPLPRG